MESYVRQIRESYVRQISGVGTTVQRTTTQT